MRSRSILFLLFTIFLVGLTNIVAATEKLTLNTLDWQPYIGQDMKDQGWVAEVVREAFRRGGYSLETPFKPWARVVEEAQNGVVDGYFPEYFAEELKNNFLLSDPFPGGPLGFFKRKGETINFKTLEDLKPYKIGVVRGYVNTAEFDAADYLKKDPVVDDLTNLKKLLRKRIDLVVADKFVGEYLMRKHLPDQAGQIEFMQPPLEIKDLYVCLSKKTPQAEAKIEAFNKGLREMIADGSYNGVMKKHGF